MSNLTGNYKINAGEVQGVDVVREQERRARLQLLDEIREPSPQPIFGEPVKVDLEDETSRRIKNTLGDFTQVLNDKNLLGISRAASSTSVHGSTQSVRNSSISKRPSIANGMYKPSTNIQKHPASEKRPGYSRNKPHDSINCPNSLQSDSRLKDQSQSEKSHLRNTGAPPSLSSANPGYTSVNPSLCPNSSNLPSNKAYSFHGRNGMVSNTTVQAPKNSESSSSASTPKRCVFRPNTLKLLDKTPIQLLKNTWREIEYRLDILRATNGAHVQLATLKKYEKLVDCPKKDQDLETILREMKQAVPPPLTAIQTPRTEESGFTFPDNTKEGTFTFQNKKSTFTAKTPEVVPQSSERSKLKESDSCQNTPSPPGKMFPKTDSCAMEPELVDLTSPCLESEKATELLENLPNESNKCVSSSLQEDLEMSESDDDVEVVSEVVTEAKSSEAKNSDNSVAEYLINSPGNTSDNLINSSSAVNNNNMNLSQTVPSNSSSSESGDSDSDDSSSESNDSDSSASSEASDADTPSKMWGLSNFFDETRRNHSPAFVPMDTSTNSSTTAVKEEPVAAPQEVREGYSLVDDDSVNGSIRDPSSDTAPNFLELETTVNIKNEILSPIISPLHTSDPTTLILPPPPPPPPQPIRGPRTPPSPVFSVTEECVDNIKNGASPENMKTDASVIVELSLPQSQTLKHSNIQQNSCDMREEVGKVQTAVSRKRLSKNKSEIFSPKTNSSPVIQSIEDESCASKGHANVSLDENDAVTLTSSYSVPSEASESSHDNYSIKTRQKNSKSSNIKRAKIVNEESLSQSCQKDTSSTKSVASKYKHSTRTSRASSDGKQLSKAVKSSKPDKSEGVKKPSSKVDSKEKSNSDKSKNSYKATGNVKGISKTSVKLKKKPSKTATKQTSESEKIEGKRKKSKFCIENFLQSPTVSQSENDLLLKEIPSIHSPSRDRSPFPDYKSSTDSKRMSVSPCASRSPSRSSSKNVERVKTSDKLRRSVRCSERTSNNAQIESSTSANQDIDTRKCTKRTPKQLERVDDSPVYVEAPPLLLSPIPLSSPIPATLSECAIPFKIMVSIPLDKLTRLPSTIHAHSSEGKSASKKSLHVTEEKEEKKSSLLFKSSKTNKHAVSKEIKHKSRTESNSKTNKGNKSTLPNKKEKNIKASNETSLPLKTLSNVNSKNSIKVDEIKMPAEGCEVKVTKKRKSVGDSKQPVKKKSKTHPTKSKDKSHISSSWTESPCNLNESSNKSKNLERCDSVSSLSSLSSQKSQRSSKEKKSSASSDSKRNKPFIPVKHIKQEKEEIPFKMAIKKEPGTPEKSKEKLGEKLHKDADFLEKNMLEPLLNDISSQYSPWGESCKEDSKTLPIAHPLMDSMNRMCVLDWDNLEMKNSKEISNMKLSNLPIMPMDYYYTEGRKQRHLAEKEKDPFVQTLKFFEATVLFILTSQQREEYTKEPESVYQFYRETLNFSNLIHENIRLQQCSPGSTEFKVLVLLLRCQALLHVKLYNLKLKEIKEQQKSVSEFFHGHCQATVRSLTHPVPSNPRMNLLRIPSPHSPTPSPASSVNSQTSGYSSSDVVSCHRNLPPFSPSVTISQNMLETICRQHTHLTNLHMGHDLWEQADMYMTRSNLREFFREVAELSENLTLHSSIKDLVNYVQTGISLVKKCSR